MLNIAITTNILPHYRYGVHKELASRNDSRITTYAGRNCLEPIRLMTEAQYSEVGAVNSPASIFRLPGNMAFTVQWRALRDIVRTKPDAVIVQGSPYELTSWFLLVWGKLTGVPILPWTIGLQRRETGLKWKMRRAMFDLGRGLLVYGDYSKDLLTQNGMAPEKIHVIYNSLDLTVQQQALKSLSQERVEYRRLELGIAPGEACFCFIGRIVARKRLAVALQAIKKLIDQGARTHFILIGDGDDVPRLKQIAADQNISEFIHFTGSLYEEADIAEYMSLCIGSIIPEAGLPIVHPMSYALVPIISDDIERHGTEWEAVKEGETGFFFADNDAASLARIIEKCTADVRKTQEIGSAAQRLAWDRYSAKSHADRIIEGVKRFRNQ